MRRESWAFLLLAIAGILGFAYQQHGRALDANRAQCLTNLAGREDAQEACDCFVENLEDRTSFLYSIILVGPLLAPADVKSGAAVEESLSACGI